MGQRIIPCPNTVDNTTVSSRAYTYTYGTSGSTVGFLTSMTLPGGSARYTYYVASIGVLVHNSCGFTDDQDALIQLGKEAKRTGITKTDADTLWSWAEEVGFGGRNDFHGPQFDSYLEGQQLHMKINGMHINIH